MMLLRHYRGLINTWRGEQSRKRNNCAPVSDLTDQVLFRFPHWGAAGADRGGSLSVRRAECWHVYEFHSSSFRHSKGVCTSCCSQCSQSSTFESQSRKRGRTPSPNTDSVAATRPRREAKRADRNRDYSRALDLEMKAKEDPNAKRTRTEASQGTDTPHYMYRNIQPHAQTHVDEFDDDDDSNEPATDPEHIFFAGIAGTDVVHDVETNLVIRAAAVCGNQTHANIEQRQSAALCSGKVALFFSGSRAACSGSPAYVYRSWKCDTAAM
ncbi:hypothetical protein B0H11DRAFT_1918368 [Mycena galericulata]|nr:hypothetical protein B0H11DRAFT_1918368 [Mycena galericulata]